MKSLWLLLFLGGIACGNPLAAKPTVRFNLAIYVLDRSGANFSITGGSVMTGPGPADKDQAWILVNSPFEFHLGTERLTAEHGFLRQPDGAPPARATLTSAPVIVASIDQTAELIVSSSAQYFEKQGDGSFRLRKGDGQEQETPHVDVALTPHAQAGDSDAYDVDCNLECSVIASRQRIPGVDLDVGKPTLASVHHHMTLKMQAGHVYGLVDPYAGDYRLIILLTASPGMKSSS